MTTTGGSHGFGTIFRMNHDGTGFQVVYAFDSTNGAGPRGTLIKTHNGRLFGMTQRGGSNNSGVIFTVDPVTGIYTKLVDFNGTNGSSPFGDLVETASGMLYGITAYGGTFNGGVIFSYDLNANIYTKLYELLGNDTGGDCEGGLILAANGKLYGTSIDGNLANGNIFSFDIATNTYASAHNLGGVAGTSPFGTPIQAPDGKIYGMTDAGGLNSVGAIYCYNLSTGLVSSPYAFDNTHGSHGVSNLTFASNGKLYGMTFQGGLNNYGVIFSLDTSSTNYNVVHDFTWGTADGADPLSGLIQSSNGLLYGMAARGGTSPANGLVFSFNTVSNLFTDLHNLDGTNDGSAPTGNLLEVSCSSYFTISPDTTQLHYYNAMNLASGAPPLQYLWSWGDGNTDTVAYPSHAYTASGFYNICLTITDATGCASTFCDSANLLRVSGSMIYVNVVHWTAGIDPFSINNNSPEPKIFPNPNDGNFRISFDFPIKNSSDNYIFEIYDISGRLISTRSVVFSTGEINLSLNNITNGIYFWKLKDVKGRSFVGKMVLHSK